MNIFRVPLNILVVAGTTAGDHLPTHMSFALIVHWSKPYTLTPKPHAHAHELRPYCALVCSAVLLVSRRRSRGLNPSPLNPSPAP